MGVRRVLEWPRLLPGSCVDVCLYCVRGSERLVLDVRLSPADLSDEASFPLASEINSSRDNVVVVCTDGG